MKLKTQDEGRFEKLSARMSAAIRIILYALLIIICAALVVGVFKTGADLIMSLNKPLDDLLQKILLDVVFIVALVEIAITVLGYLKDGEVHVRYIVDTVLIIMLNEVVGLFFKGAELNQLIGISVVIATLAAIRLSVTRFGPRTDP